MSIFAAIPVEVPAVVTVEAPRRKIDWVEVRAQITQAVAEAYAEATDEEIYQKVMQPLIDARNGLIGTHTTRRRINPNPILEYLLLAYRYSYGGTLNPAPATLEV